MRSTVVRARKGRLCDSVTQGLGSDQCTRTIKPGDKYARSVVSPDHDDYGNDGWLRSTVCLPCARRYPVTWPPELLAETARSCDSVADGAA